MRLQIAYVLEKRLPTGERRYLAEQDDPVTGYTYQVFVKDGLSQYHFRSIESVKQAMAWHCADLGPFEYLFYGEA